MTADNPPSVKRWPYVAVWLFSTAVVAVALFPEVRWWQ